MLKQFFINKFNISLALFSLITFSCIKKEKLENFEIAPFEGGWGLPLIDSELSIGNIIDAIDNNVTLVMNPDSSYTFNYFDTIVSPSAESIFILNDENANIVASFPSTLPPSIPNGISQSGSINGSELLSISDGSQLKSILFKAGRMVISLNTNLRHTIKATLNIPSMKRNGVAFSKEFTSTFSNGNIIAPSATSEDLSGYNIELTGNGSETNKLNYTISFVITGSGQPISPNDKINISLSFQSMKFKNMIGSLTASQQFDEFDRNTDIKIFDNALAGNLSFAFSTVSVTTDNSFGIPVKMGVDKMNASNAYDGSLVNFTGKTNGFDVQQGRGTIDVKAPLLANIGKNERTTFVLNNDNSNVKEIIKPASNELNYVLKPSFVGGADQFITDESILKVYVKVAIPIYGILERYELGDTLKVGKLPIRSDDEFTVDSARLRFKTTNSLPFDTYSQIYFVDSNNVRLDSLLLNPGEFIKRPVIDSKGKAIKATEQVTIIGIAGPRYDRIKSKMSYMYIYSRLLTSKDENGVQKDIQIFYNNKLRIEFCALAKGQARINTK